jgi:HAD superfamily hydrolase (TIGR01509 family)
LPVVIKAILFDIDGTLIDSVDLHARAWQEALADFGYEVGFEAVRSQIGKGGDQLMPVFVPKDDLERRGDELESHRSELFKRKYLPDIRPFPGVRSLFEQLRADGKTIVLASSAKADELQRYARIAEIEDLVDATTSSDEVERSKPFGDIFAAALGKAAPTRAEEALVVGDTPYDAQAAGKVGIRTVGVLCGGFPEAELRAAGCVAIFRDPADLLARYEQSPLAE